MTWYLWGLVVSCWVPLDTPCHSASAVLFLKFTYFLILFYIFNSWIYRSWGMKTWVWVSSLRSSWSWRYRWLLSTICGYPETNLGPPQEDRLDRLNCLDISLAHTLSYFVFFCVSELPLIYSLRSLLTLPSSWKFSWLLLSIFQYNLSPFQL